MKFLLVYLRMYGRCLADAFAALLKNPWTVLLPVALALVMGLLSPLLAPLRMVGGFIMVIAFDLLASCYLYFLGGVVSKQPVGLKDLKASFLAYFWSVMNLGFVLWIVNLALGFALSGNPRGGAVKAAFALLSAVLLNVTPEVMYLKGSVGGIETIQRSVRFLQENWIEWFIPNGLFIAAAWYLPALGGAVGAALNPIAWLLTAGVLGGVLGHVLMVFRGHLFLELDGSTHRQRMYKHGRAG